VPWFNNKRDDDKDLFVSYDWLDNSGGWVEGFVQALAEVCRRTRELVRDHLSGPQGEQP
jgi:hypothetical protein